jgi:signal transduction histidine kinase
MAGVRSLTAGRQVHWIAVDCAAAVVLAVLVISHAAAQRPQAGVPGWAAIAASAVTALLIAVRRIRPAAVYAAVLAANTLVTVAGVSGNPGVTVALALYAVAVTQPPSRSLAALGTALALTLPAQAYPGLTSHPAPSRLVLEYAMTVTAVIIAASWVIGAMQRRYAAHSAAQHARTAVTDERLRLARELHDIISNSMALITAKAAVTNYLIDSRPDDARAALAMIEETGRDALTEMRRLLGILRGGGSPQPSAATGQAGACYTSVPGLAGVQALAVQATAAGVPTTVDIRGEKDLPEAMALSIYRIVQEAVTNVIKHAGPARCAVQVDLTGDDVIVDITDDGYPRLAPADQAGGHGLIGMRERVSLFDGEFTAGYRPEGGFRVTARLPAGSARPEGGSRHRSGAGGALAASKGLP